MPVQNRRQRAHAPPCPQISRPQLHAWRDGAPLLAGEPAGPVVIGELQRHRELRRPLVLPVGGESDVARVRHRLDGDAMRPAREGQQLARRSRSVTSLRRATSRSGCPHRVGRQYGRRGGQQHVEAWRAGQCPRQLQLARPKSAQRCSSRSRSGQSRRRAGSSRTRPCIACRPYCNIGPSTSSSSLRSMRTS